MPNRKALLAILALSFVCAATSKSIFHEVAHEAEHIIDKVFKHHHKKPKHDDKKKKDEIFTDKNITHVDDAKVIPSNDTTKVDETPIPVTNDTSIIDQIRNSSETDNSTDIVVPAPEKPACLLKESQDERMQKDMLKFI